MQIINKATGERRNNLSIDKAKQNGYYLVEDNAPILSVDMKWWKDGVNSWTPVEKDSEEKAAIITNELEAAKEAKLIKIRTDAENAVKSIFVGTGITQERIIAYLWVKLRNLIGADQMNSELETAFDQALIANTQAEAAKIAALEAATTIEEIEAV